MSESEQQPCLNCGTPLQGTYCFQCGQKAQNRRLPLKALLHDVLHDLLHLDHKILESVWLLIRRPGFLAEEYLAGRRVRHVPPFRLYVIASFALFMAFSFIHVGDTHGKPNKAVRSNVVTLHSSMPQTTEPGTAEHDKAQPAEKDSKAEKAEKAEKTGKVEKEDKAESWARDLNARAKLAQEDPERFYHTFLSNLSKSLFVLMPVFAALLMLLHLRRSESLFVDHMVVALHHHVVCFLAILLLMGLNALPGDGWGCIPGPIIFFAPLAHLAATLQRLYRRGWIRSIAKAILVSTVYGFIVSVALVGLLWLSLPKVH